MCNRIYNLVFKEKEELGEASDDMLGKLLRGKPTQCHNPIHITKTHTNIGAGTNKENPVEWEKGSYLFIYTENEGGRLRIQCNKETCPYDEIIIMPLSGAALRG